MPLSRTTDCTTEADAWAAAETILHSSIDAKNKAKAEQEAAITALADAQEALAIANDNYTLAQNKVTADQAAALSAYGSYLDCRTS